MSELIRESKPVARKHYPCEASHWICQASLADNEYEPDDLLLIEAARADKWKILPCSKYIYQVSRVDGELQVFRARQDMHNLCLKYELYPEE